MPPKKAATKKQDGVAPKGKRKPAQSSKAERPTRPKRARAENKDAGATNEDEPEEEVVQSPKKKPGKKAAASKATPEVVQEKSLAPAQSDSVPEPASKKRPRKKTAAADAMVVDQKPKEKPEFPGIVLTLGAGDMAQLGLGSEESMRERKFPTVVKALSEENIVSIAAGSLHNAALNDEGQVFTWGCNDDGALGRDPDNDAASWLPARVTHLDQTKIVAVRCGSSHTLALSEDGAVYVAGCFRDSQGILGISETVEKALEPVQVAGLLGHKIVQIAAGSNHDLALTSKGEVYQWGDVGVGTRGSARKKTTRCEPHRVLFKGLGKAKITQIFAGGYTSFALDSTDRVWVWGPNNYHMCGIPNKADAKSASSAAPAASAAGDGDEAAPSSDAPKAPSDLASYVILIPTVIPTLTGKHIVKVAADVHHSLAIDDQGQVYSFGRGDSGRLGLGNEDSAETPTPIPFFQQLAAKGDKVLSAACGEAVSLACTSSGQMYTWGDGDLLQLGNGKMENELVPYHVASKIPRMVLQVDAGSQHSVLLIRETPETAAARAAAKAPSSSSSSSSPSTVAASAAPAAVSSPPPKSSPPPSSPAPSSPAPVASPVPASPAPAPSSSSMAVDASPAAASANELWDAASKLPTPVSPEPGVRPVTDAAEASAESAMPPSDDD